MKHYNLLLLYCTMLQIFVYLIRVPAPCLLHFLGHKMTAFSNKDHMLSHSNQGWGDRGKGATSHSSGQKSCGWFSLSNHFLWTGEHHRSGLDDPNWISLRIRVRLVPPKLLRCMLHNVGGVK